jgi:hypothetical protein
LFKEGPHGAKYPVAINRIFLTELKIGYKTGKRFRELPVYRKSYYSINRVFLTELKIS